MNLESAWQLWHARENSDDKITRRAHLYSIAPIKDMLRRGWIAPSENIEVLEQQLRDFFECEDLTAAIRFPHAARKSTPYDDGEETLAQKAWLFRSRKLARAVQVGDRFNDTSLARAVERLKMLQHIPQEARHVARALADAGIRFLILEPLPGTKIDGASFWLDNDSPVIVLSMRFDRIDNFWFTLMHEVGHLKKRDGALDVDLRISQDEDQKPLKEQEADAFASASLIEPAKLEGFIARVGPLYSLTRLTAFAAANEVHPGIVVGQLQGKGEIPFSSFRKVLSPMRKWVIESALTDGWEASVPANL